MNTRLGYLILLGCTTILLNACGKNEDFKDLRDTLAKLDGPTQDTSKKDMKTLPLPVPVQYQRQASRTPYEEMDQPKPGGGNATVVSGGHPLVSYQLNLLRFVGTITKNNQVLAYILTPDNKVYEVGIGDTIGNHSGKIVKIDANRVEVVEKVEETQTGTERIITLQLKEENE